MNKGGFDSNKVKVWTRLVNTVCIIVIIICFVTIVIPGSAAKQYSGSGSVNNTASAAEREALPSGSVNETAYFTENAFLDDPIVIEKGLKRFYEITGVQPYVDIITSIKDNDNPFVRDIAAYAKPLYRQLFTDESHLLLVFCFDFEWDDYDCYIVTGSKAKTVVDSEAENILLDYIKLYFDDLGLSEEMFSNAFSDAADRIMNITQATSSGIPVSIFLGGAVILVLLFVWLININRKKKIRARQNEEILGMPLEQYGADTAAKAKIPSQNYVNVSDSPAESGNAANAAAVQEAHIKRIIDMNIAETAKYDGLARQALKAGREDDARIFIGKKLDLEAAHKALDAAYNNVVNMRRMSGGITGNVQSQTINVKTTVMKDGKIINQTSYSNSPQGAPDVFSSLGGEADRLLAQANAMLAAMNNMQADSSQAFHEQAAQGDPSYNSVSVTFPKDDAEALAEKYAAVGNPAVENVPDTKTAGRYSPRVSDELANMKKDMGL